MTIRKFQEIFHDTDYQGLMKRILITQEIIAKKPINIIYGVVV